MNKQELYNQVIAYFQETRPIAETELTYKDPFQLLIAVILSAQCTDKRVNMITPRLFQDFPTPEAMAASTPDVEDASAFALEKHLEDFLVKNWKQTSLGKNYDIYEEDGELVGQQYPSDTGPIDILAISKDKKTMLVIELKRGRTSDVVVGQVQRYMGYVKEELLEQNQTVKGLIIGLEADNKLKRALSVCQNIEFYRYQIDFKLIKE